MTIFNNAVVTFDKTFSILMNSMHDAVNQVTVSAAQQNHMYRWLETEINQLHKNQSLTPRELTKLFALQSQRDNLEISFSPAPGWEKWLQANSGIRPAKKVSQEIIFGWQRLVRGWDDSSLWNLDAYVCRTLGEQLNSYADTSHGWPLSTEFPDPESWEAALRFHGGQLSRYSERYDALNNEEEAVLVNQAQDSLKWVAEHLSNLWD